MKKKTKENKTRCLLSVSIGVCGNAAVEIGLNMSSKFFLIKSILRLLLVPDIRL